MNAKKVRDALASLDGKLFESKEAVENAVFPLFSPLTALFHGEGHRDLVDRLISARWLEVVKGKWVLSLPPVEKFTPAVSPTTQPTEAFDTAPGQSPYTVGGVQKSASKNDAMAAILRDDYKEAIRILTTLL